MKTQILHKTKYGLITIGLRSYGQLLSLFQINLEDKIIWHDLLWLNWHTQY